jgi:hypothetical protein
VSALVRFPLVQASLAAAPTLVVVLAAFLNREAVFLIPQTLLASVAASAVSADRANRQWGLHGLLAGVITIVLSLITFILLVD